MTDLQKISLIIAFFILVVVYAFNWWQEYRYRNRVKKTFAHKQQDVLLEIPTSKVRAGEARRLEPKWELLAKGKEPLASFSHAEKNGRHEPPSLFPIENPGSGQHRPGEVSSSPGTPSSVAISPQIGMAIGVPPIQEDRPDLLDPTLDFICEIRARKSIPAAVIPPFPGVKRVLSIGEAHRGHWEVIKEQSGSAYHHIRIGMQLTDRQGPLTQEQLNIFCLNVQQFADSHESTVVFPARSAKLQQAKALDAFCSQVDMLLSIHITMKDQAYPIEQVFALAEREGLVLGEEGYFHYCSAAGKPLFTLTNRHEIPFNDATMGNTTTGITLLFDIPRVKNGLTVFDFFVNLAQNLATTVNGYLVDEDNKPLGKANLERTRKQLAIIYVEMENHGIPAGSPAALRLFS